MYLTYHDHFVINDCTTFITYLSTFYGIMFQFFLRWL